MSASFDSGTLLRQCVVSVSVVCVSEETLGCVCVWVRVYHDANERKLSAIDILSARTLDSKSSKRVM